MSVKLDFDVLPEKATFQEGIRRAPDRGFLLNAQAQTEIALLKMLLRYILKIHQELIPEFLERTKTRGLTGGTPVQSIASLAEPIDEYKGKCTAAIAQAMIDNN